MIPRSPRPDATARRGMLLLLVLSILALFIVVGAVGILVALRARDTARAFAAASASQSASGALARVQLDEALLKLVRGPSQPTPPGTPAKDVVESILEDKYGPQQSCTVTGLTGSASAFITATVTGLDLSNPAAVAGRVLTFVPAANDPTGPTSYRILRTGTAPNTLLLANVKPTTPLPLPNLALTGTCEAVVNGREFVVEPYDAFDDQNQFLTQPVLEKSQIVSVARPAFGPPGTPCTVDNDGDGVPDGIWLDNVLPPQRSPDGGQLSFAVSYLVLDLDGRINLNAHGSFVQAQLPLNTTRYPKDPATVPVGLGYGPADVDASLLVRLPNEASGTIASRYVRLLQGGALTPSGTVSTPTQWRPTPRAEPTQPGRYGGPGTGAVPGGSMITGTNPLNSDAWLTGNSPTDLKARLQMFVEGSPPTLKIARPFPAWAVSDSDDVLGSGTNAHPYRMRLDEDAPRAAGAGANDAVFTVGELERILRQFDADAYTQPPRLAALLDDYAERSRMTVTTDSWDTPAITGDVVTRLAGSVTAGNVYAVHSPEVVAGLRFNLNRPITSGSARLDYFRQLYTLLVALQVPAGDAAQWAANVIEFRDPDSIMTWYPYDPTPLDGVWTTGTGVWGAERPEMVITDASVTGNQATIKLYRPWNAQLFTGTSTVASGTTERIDASLGNAGANTLDATNVTTSGSAVWRLSVGGSTTALRTLMPTATAVSTNADVGTATITAPSPPTTVVLQRLADPTRDPVASATETRNDYVDVHIVTPGMAGAVSRWLHWPNRDLVSHGELLAVQSGDVSTLAEVLVNGSGKETSLARDYPAILDATIVPSRFVGANVSVANAATVLANSGFENFPHGQFSRWREAGRVNVNTILTNTGNAPSVLDNAVWTALVGRTDVTNPVTSGNYAPIPNLQSLLSGAVLDRSGAASAFLRRATAIRLANVATTRSHVFAVWITLRITDSSVNAGAPQYARLFAIVDRSIPAACAPGRTLNVRETIRLQRFLQ